MKVDKICIVLILILAFAGMSWGSEVWVQENPEATSYKFSDLSAEILVTIKNNNDHVQYFKISHAYQGSLAEMENNTILWVIDWTSPAAVKMVKSRYPELGGDYGWKIQPGETKSVCFKLSAVGQMGQIPSYIIRADSDQGTYWPLVPEPGLMASWFVPNELEILNPNLDILRWKGNFSFRLTNVDSTRVSGIVRAPIVPVDSKLTYSNPRATFLDDELAVDTQIASWDVVMEPGASRVFNYVYEWPMGRTSSSTTQGRSSSIPTAGAQENTTSVPTRDTGVPYGLFVVGALVAGAGVVYAKFMRQ
ncbi:MAG: hypothetical protein KKF16_06980 [Euryarchaeota archaeon]|nr:hypothetical protein [Euryarchaeota archaeon]MBU4606940.1 hypothetical protein [Euryarchaeota archaeon]MBV1729255.1 hypothetical protein [Methanobacterium sp.]MBV1754663.1 hypothetical protein [Methanobacterium sp.]